MPAHYTRHKRVSAVKKWLDEHVQSDLDECLISPFKLQPNGYLRFRHNRQNLSGHRYMLKAANPSGRFEGAQAAHTCGNRACVNPRHLYWATAEQNSADRVQHGTHARGGQNGFAKLTDEDALAIRKLRREGVSLREVGRIFGVCKATITSITHGRAWTHLPLETSCDA